MTPWLYACTVETSSAVFEEIFIRLPEMAGVSDTDGNLSLHLYLEKGKSNYSIKIIKFLHHANPEATLKVNDDGNVLLHICIKHILPLEICQAILLYDWEAVTIKDDDGALPVSLACEYRSNYKLICEICKHYSEAVSVINLYGHTPLHTLCNTKQEDVPDIDSIETLVDADPKMITDPDDKEFISPL